jgi:hypothetical protein
MFKARLSTTLTGQDLLNLKSDNALTILPHQRLMKNHTLKDAQTLYEALKHGMSVPLQFSVLKKILENSIKQCKEFHGNDVLEKEISKGCIFGIEDGQHRINCFASIFKEYNSYFSLEEQENLLKLKYQKVLMNYLKST